MAGMRRVFDKMSNEGYGRKRIVQIMLASCLFFILPGCGKTTYDVTTMEFAKNGHIIEHIVEEFPADLYDEAEWENGVRSQIDEYNSKDKGRIDLENVVYENNILKCSLNYEDDNAYYYLNEQPIFYGTIAEAIKAGYGLTLPVYSVSDGTQFNSDRLRLMNDAKIIIMNSPMDIKLYDSASYISGNVTLKDDKKSGSITDNNACYIVIE